MTYWQNTTPQDERPMSNELKAAWGAFGVFGCFDFILAFGEREWYGLDIPALLPLVIHALFVGFAFFSGTFLLLGGIKWLVELWSMMPKQAQAITPEGSKYEALLRELPTWKSKVKWVELAKYVATSEKPSMTIRAMIEKDMMPYHIYTRRTAQDTELKFPDAMLKMGLAERVNGNGYAWTEKGRGVMKAIYAELSHSPTPQ